MNRIIRWLPAVVWMTLIFYMSHQTGDDLGTLLPFFQNWFPWMASFDWGHFIAYFVLALTYYGAMFPRWAGWGGKALVVVLCLLYGVTDEFHQRFVEDRTPDLMDLRNDTIGAAIAMAVVSLPPVDRLLRKLIRR
ncbi:VanZ family protein [Paenibacillus sp. GCM10012303]|uniref:VanZ family protein n=1 Tax=Paenibacillus sp. GCM10012303 TaxID=3317340 RepID=UPI003611C647